MAHALAAATDMSGMTDGKAVATGIDVGGTFTDLAAIAFDGTVITAKVLSVSADRAAGVVAALNASALAPASVAYIAHGTTVVTNLLLERRGARVVACITAGFTDLLELRRQERAALYDLTRHHPAPLVPAVDVVAVAERMGPDGVIEPLTQHAVEHVVREVVTRRPDTVAITLLHAYANTAHEAQLADALRLAISNAGLSCDVICSHTVLPEIREYERLTTTVAEAYARPAVRAYFTTLGDRLLAHHFPLPRVMTSAGGTLPATAAAQHAASLALSGPAGGVTGAGAVARTLGISTALTIDIGGTSADVGLIIDGEPLVERGGMVAGVPIALPRVLVEAVAAGGGSIGWIDAGGALRAGPESAGATPGPAAYGAGGTQPTVTDAHVVLGHIAEGAWSGGVTISRACAYNAMTSLASPLGVTVERAADALIATADATMARALRRVSVERGINPRDAVLIAFGGGGPLHACGLADQLGIQRIVVPPCAGVLSAVGLALAPERRERVSSFVRLANSIVAHELSVLLEREAHTLGATVAAQTATQWWVHARFEGQGHELDISVVPGDTAQTITDRFIERHVARTGFALDRPVECISIRTAVTKAAWPVKFQRPSRADVQHQSQPPAADVDDVDDGAALTRQIRGPGVMRLPDATMFVADGWVATALPIGGWLMERS